MRQKFDLQLFAAGDNNDLPARSYQLEFKRLLQAVFKKQSYFADFFGGSIEAMDGIQENETAFYVKTSDIPCVCGTGYDKTATKAFGTGTGNSFFNDTPTTEIYTLSHLDAFPILCSWLLCVNLLWLFPFIVYANIDINIYPRK